MKKIFLVILVLTVMITVSAVAQTTNAADISFSYTRLSGSASNQFAIWIEDAQGNFVKTLYATRWTANGGWRRRETSIPLWIQKAGVTELSQAQIDAVSGATPRTGQITHTWDGTNSVGRAVPDGNYVIVLEGTLRWGNQVYYRAPIRLGGGAATPQVSVEYVGDAGNDRAMISDVVVRVLR